MLMIYAVIILGSILLALGRSILADILHLLSAIAAFAVAYFMTPAVTESVQPLTDSYSSSLLIQRMLNAASAPLLFTLVFVAAFIAIGTATHVIGNLIKIEKRPKFIVKAVLSLIAGLFIAYALQLPLGYYPDAIAKADGIKEAVDADFLYGLPDLSAWRSPSFLYQPIYNRIAEVNIEGHSYTAEECLNAISEVQKVVRSLSAEDYAAYSDEIARDEAKDILYGCAVRDFADTFSDKIYQRIFADDGKFSSKLKAVSIPYLLKEIFNYPAKVRKDIDFLFENADAETYNIVADICDYDTIKMYDSFAALNAPFLAEILREIGKLEGADAQTLAREAEAVTYIIAPAPGRSQYFEYDQLDDEKTAEYIASSTVLQNAYINVTQNGTIMDPCKMSTEVYDSHRSTIIYLLDTVYGFGQDSDLYRSMLAYFGIKEI